MMIRVLLLLITTLSLVASPFGFSMHQGLNISTAATQASDFAVTFFPVAPYHVGDVLSARVTYTGKAEIGEERITIALADQPDQVLATATFSGSTNQAVFYWVFDTHGAQPGFINFLFTIPGIDSVWTAGIHLLPDPGNRHTAWSEVTTSCCTLHYLTGTDAEADLPDIVEAVEKRTALALDQFAAGGVLEDSPIEDPLSIILVPIVIGHSGFATHEAVLTYTHRNWSGIDFEILIHHEIVHVIDRLINTEGPRPSLFVEGIAVYLSGGHYREGDPLARAAALLAADLYIPISEIVDDFYAAQHEIGYMQAAALVAYLDRLWGWETFIDFYFNLPEGPSDSAIISSALEARFGIDLAELEADFITNLETLEPDSDTEVDVRLTVEIYDMLRRYQTLVIPSAYFRSPWWPPIDQMREHGIVGDYALREKAPLNVIVEGYFMQIHTALEAGNFSLAEAALGKIDEILTRVENTGIIPVHYAIGWPTISHPGGLTLP